MRTAEEEMKSSHAGARSISVAVSFVWTERTINHRRCNINEQREETDGEQALRLPLSSLY